MVGMKLRAGVLSGEIGNVQTSGGSVETDVRQPLERVTHAARRRWHSKLTEVELALPMACRGVH